VPHLILEYTDNIAIRPDFKALFLELHTLLNNLAGAELASCKSRALELKEYVIGDGSQNHAFVHLNISLLAGRSQSIKEKIGNTALQLLEEHFRNAYQQKSLQLTVKMQDMPVELYFKTTQAFN